MFDRAWRQIIGRGLLGSSLMLCGACGAGNKAEPYIGKTRDEKVQAAMKAGNCDRAIELLLPVTTEDDPPAGASARERFYARFPLLAAAYACESGFDLLGAVQGSAAGASDLSALFEADANEENLESLRLARDTLLLIPEALRDVEAGDPTDYAASAAKQLQVYASFYPMRLMQFLGLVNAAGEPDVAAFAALDAADQLAIVESLADAAATFPSDSDDPLKTSIVELQTTLGGGGGAP
jgi:hypothetical protein